MDCKMTDIIAIISSIIAIGYSIYSIITKSYIRQYNLEKFEHFSLNPVSYTHLKIVLKNKLTICRFCMF